MSTYYDIPTLDCCLCVCVCTILHVTWTNPIAVSVSRVGSLQQFSLPSFVIQPPACAETIYLFSILPVLHPPKTGNKHE